MLGNKLGILLVSGFLALSNGEKFHLQGSESSGRHLKGEKKMKEKKAEKSSYKKSVGYHLPGYWLLYSYYQRAQNPENNCEHLTSVLGFPQGVCANYYQNTEFYWLNYAGQSKEDIIRMWSFFKDSECKVPTTAKPNFFLPAQGVLAHPKICETKKENDPLADRNVPIMYILQDNTPRYEGVVLFNTFPTPETCATNDIGSTFEFWFNKNDACGQIAANSSFLPEDIRDNFPALILYGAKMVECNDHQVSFDVYRDAVKDDSVLCKSTATIDRVTFLKMDTCKQGGQTTGAASGFVNYKCV